jgi:hypothetical protein
MEKLIKRSGLFVVSFLIAGASQAAEVLDPNFANTQRICECYKTTGTANCQPLNAANTDQANQQGNPAAVNTGGAHRP